MPSTETRLPQRQQTGIRLHYFPDIPVDEPANARQCTPLEDNFQRVDYNKIDSNSMDLASEFDGDGVILKKGALSAAKLNEQAYQKGFSDGISKGMIDGEKKGFVLGGEKIEPLLSSLQKALLQVHDIRKQTYHGIEKQVVELALAVAKQVICREVAMEKKIVVGIARKALTQIEDPGKIKIKMNTSDLQFINETKYPISDRIVNMDNVVLEAEDGIESGGCIVETDLGEIDARIEKQLQAVEESFRAIMDKSRD